MQVILETEKFWQFSTEPKYTEKILWSGKKNKVKHDKKGKREQEKAAFWEGSWEVETKGTTV